MKFIISLLFITICFSNIELKAVEKDITEGASAGKYTKVGAAGAQFLKIGFGARSSAMSGASGASVNDLSAIFWNPAGVAEVKSLTTDFSYTSWFGEFTHNFGAIAIPIGSDFTLAASVISFSSDDILITTLDFPDGKGNYYSTNDVAIGATFAGFLTDQFSFGVTAKYVKTGLASLSSGGFAFDAGTKYETGIQGIRLGFSIHNLGTEQELRGQDLKQSGPNTEGLNNAPLDMELIASPFLPPLIFRAGVAGNVIQDDNNLLTAEVDFVTLSDSPEQFIIGAEYMWNELVAVRAGYHLGHDQFGLGAGVGLKYTGGGFTGHLDYAINPTFDLGLVHRFSISLVMGD